jgi:hypothetical protein
MPLKDQKIGNIIKKPELEICKVCLRSFENRKRWSSHNLWEKIQYCSKHCRRMKDNEEYKNKFKAK